MSDSGEGRNRTGRTPTPPRASPIAASGASSVRGLRAVADPCPFWRRGGRRSFGSSLRWLNITGRRLCNELSGYLSPVITVVTLLNIPFALARSFTFPSPGDSARKNEKREGFAMAGSNTGGVKVSSIVVYFLLNLIIKIVFISPIGSLAHSVALERSRKSIDLFYLLSLLRSATVWFHVCNLRV